jgi:biotin-dependent carboxylase-like uncharacterized protein
MTLEVNSPGLSTTVQDLGRPGYYHIGIPISGGMDRFAVRCANMLAGNAESAAVLEAVFTGPELRFGQDAIIAVTGADMPVKIDGVEHPGWTALKVRAGQTLSFGFLKSGARAYIAVSGGIDVPVVLGSRSTYTLGALGGHRGRKLEKGDRLPVGAVGGPAREGVSIAHEIRRGPAAGEVTLRTLPGLYSHRVTQAAQERFFSDSWKVAPEADRIGYRFRGGTPLAFEAREQPFGAGADPSNIVDACYPYGSIQVPGGIEPIVLHRDAVSGGGYFMIGTVISADMDLIGQLQPHTRARFVPVDMSAALQARRDRAKALAAVRASLGLTTPA